MPYNICFGLIFIAMVTVNKTMTKKTEYKSNFTCSITSYYFNINVSVPQPLSQVPNKTLSLYKSKVGERNWTTFSRCLPTLNEISCCTDIMVTDLVEKFEPWEFKLEIRMDNSTTVITRFFQKNMLIASWSPLLDGNLCLEKQQHILKAYGQYTDISVTVVLRKYEKLFTTSFNWQIRIIGPSMDQLFTIDKTSCYGIYCHKTFQGFQACSHYYVCLLPDEENEKQKCVDVNTSCHESKNQSIKWNETILIAILVIIVASILILLYCYCHGGRQENPYQTLQPYQNLQPRNANDIRNTEHLYEEMETYSRVQTNNEPAVAV
ncbi:uncharacterized protein LOC130625336 [Hydractinia symbiolongicarpus]|uniref:uncharacterized protein LOC130625336 n=1 Tax=Hydractinia symbiolongicarpus TaxID=13093 RepID=UPI00254A60DF|nr:uncharacterized protein LOC130625336 [Hydractinia symbiolongicarpus]XP_057296395.1 uncharacterized protein LOC130625336 [Hydractinia symbiolongicarpus]XP_057296396.1 uncharacterized protein LOC130625336 [Hydractinia symbiolongicarpus]XP_057296397.1 uncharacterized protein LOC130625336 [Hydractinia symbiolongicarpus]